MADGGGGGGVWLVAAAAIVSARGEASRSVGWLALALGETDRDSLELRETAGGNTRGTEGETDYRDRQSRTLGGKHSNKTTTCNNNTHQHRSAAERSRSRSRSREALRHELMYTNQLAELRLARPLPIALPPRSAS